MKALLEALHLPIQACGAQSRWGWGLAGEGARGRAWAVGAGQAGSVRDAHTFAGSLCIEASQIFLGRLAPLGL